MHFIVVYCRHIAVCVQRYLSPSLKVPKIAYNVHRIWTHKLDAESILEFLHHRHNHFLKYLEDNVQPIVVDSSMETYRNITFNRLSLGFQLINGNFSSNVYWDLTAGFVYVGTTCFISYIRRQTSSWVSLMLHHCGEIYENWNTDGRWTKEQAHTARCTRDTQIRVSIWALLIL